MYIAPIYSFKSQLNNVSKNAIKMRLKSAKSDNSLMADEWWGLLISLGFHHKHLGNSGQLWETLSNYWQLLVLCLVF